MQSTLGHDVEELILRPDQEETKERLRQAFLRGWRKVILCAPTGSGKCHPAGTRILLHDGNTVPVENVVPGDRLMGTDSQPRTVQSISAGYGQIVKVTPVKGEPWFCNDDHVLTLVRTGEKDDPVRRHRNRSGEMVDVSIREWRTWARSRKHLHKLVRAGVEFSGRELAVDPYLLGVLLGDGTLLRNRVAVTTVDPEIVQAIEDAADEWGLSIRADREDPIRPPTFYLRHDTLRGANNPLIRALRGVGAYGARAGTKSIPQEYQTASRAQRLELLAGLMDTDGHMSDSGFDFISKSSALAQGVAFVARSLGLAAYVKLKEQKEGIYWRVTISGDCHLVPTRIARKRAPVRRQKKDVLRTGFTVEYDREDRYYGFTLDGDGRYLLADFTVTHNTIHATDYMMGARAREHRSLFVNDRLALIDQSEAVLRRFGVPHTVQQGNRPFSSRELVMVASAQTLERRKWPQSNLLLIDEAHTMRESIIEAVKAHEGFAIGLTATPVVPGMADVWDGVVNAATTDQLIAQGELAPLKVYAEREIDMTDAPINNMGEWAAAEVSQRSKAIVGDIVTTWEKRTREHFGGAVKTLVFSASVDDGRVLVEAFQRAGYDFRQVSYLDNPDDRKEVIRGFRAGDGAIGLVSVEALAKGFDVPDVMCIVGARPYRKSFAGHIQQIGRGMRSSPGKEYCLYLDHSGNMPGWIAETLDLWQHGVDRLRSKRQTGTPTRKDGPDRADIVCSCGLVLMPGVRTCPACGRVRPGRIGMAEYRPGELEELDMAGWREIQAIDDSSPVKQRLAVWKSICEMALERHPNNHARGRSWAFAQYKNWFGRWPPGREVHFAPVGDPPLAGVRAKVERQIKAWREEQRREQRRMA